MPQHNNKGTISLFFDVCANIERTCAELYHFYSLIHQENEDVSRLWKKTALEEENHQKQFELANRLIDDVDIELDSDLERAGRIYQKMNHLLEHVQQNPPDIITALNKAIEMEERLVDLHLGNSVRFKDKMIQRMFHALSEFDQDHIKSLRLCLAVVTLPQSEMSG